MTSSQRPRIWCQYWCQLGSENRPKLPKRAKNGLKKWNDFGVAHSRPAKLVTHLLYTDPPASQEPALAVGKVFVENDH